VTGLELERVDNVSIVRSRQDIDAANAAQVRGELIAFLDRGPDCLVFDLSATRYLDSAALDMLFRLNERLRQRRATLRLVIPPTSQLTRLVEIVALPAALAIHESLEEALEACHRGAGGEA
jgi:anti-anti-sigma factor